MNELSVTSFLPTQAYYHLHADKHLDRFTAPCITCTADRFKPLDFRFDDVMSLLRMRISNNENVMWLKLIDVGR